MLKASPKPAFVDMQTNFARKVIRRENGVPSGIISHSSKQPQARFNVHRNNFYLSLSETLESRFPVIKRLLGEEFFTALAREFLALFPPQSPVLLEYGGDFPVFLETFEPVAELLYLPDVARLEWARNLAFHASDALPMSTETLAALKPEEVGNVTFHFHPSAQLLSSPYPVVSIWETNTHDDEVRTIGPELPGENALIVRPEFEVQVVRLDPGAETFISRIAEGASLAEAGEYAAQEFPHFLLDTTLTTLFVVGAFTGFSIKQQT
jgi:hypothetical protein